MKLSARILSILVVAILLAVPAFAQTGQGVINGKIVGRDGMPAANVQLIIQRMNSLNANQRQVAQSFDVKSGKNGSFSFNGLPPGTYQVGLIENGKIIMMVGDTPGTFITVSDSSEGRANFDMRNAPAAAAAGAGGAAAPSAADLAKERADLEKASANKSIRDKAFAAGTAAYKGAATAEPTAKDDAAKAAVTAQYEEAVKQFQIVTVADPKQDVAFANLGNSYNKLKKYDEAAAAYQKAIQLKPLEAAYQNNLGLAFGGMKKLDEAKTAFEAAAAMDPLKAGDYLFNEGAMYNNNADYPNAIKAFEKTLVADPNNKGAMLQLAISFFGSEATMPNAEPLLKKFLTLNPTPADAELAKQLMDAIHTTGPTEFKSEKAIADEKKKAEQDAKDAANKAKAPAKAAPGKGKSN